MHEVQPTLPPSEFVKEVVPFAAEEVSLDIPEEQSPTPMNEGVLDELTLEVEATVAQGN